MTENEELKAQIAALTERVAQLEGRGRPSAPMRNSPFPLRDLTAGMSMPPEALREMAKAVGGTELRQITSDLRTPGELAPARGGNPTPSFGRSGWRNAAPLDVPGIALADMIVDAQDARDRAELIEQEARRRALNNATR